MLQFDENGFLKPYSSILVTLDELEASFVFNKHRTKLYETYLQFLRELQNFEIANLSQLIDGSFVTQKPFPKDIDIVNIIDYRIDEKYGNILREFARNFKQLDIYFITEYPLNHRKRWLFESDLKEWEFLFSQTRLNPLTGKKYSKGFIQINF